MIILDTCAMIFDALSPEQLGKRARTELAKGRLDGCLSCSDISLWEIAMLINKRRLQPAMAPAAFLADVIAANRLRVLPITPEIAILATIDGLFDHNDPADRIIAATAMHHKGLLLTCDQRLRDLKGLKTAW